MLKHIQFSCRNVENIITMYNGNNIYDSFPRNLRDFLQYAHENVDRYKYCIYNVKPKYAPLFEDKNIYNVSFEEPLDAKYFKYLKNIKNVLMEEGHFGELPKIFHGHIRYHKKQKVLNFDGYNYGGMKINARKTTLKNCKIDRLYIRANEVTLINCDATYLEIQDAKKLTIDNVRGHEIQYSFITKCDVVKYNNVAYSVHYFDRSVNMTFATDAAIKTAIVKLFGYIPFNVRTLCILRHDNLLAPFDMICQIGMCPYLEELYIDWIEPKWLHILVRHPRIKRINIVYKATSKVKFDNFIARGVEICYIDHMPTLNMNAL